MPTAKSQRTVGNIPERYRSGMAAIINLPAPAFEELKAALNRAPSFVNSKELAAWVAPESKIVPEGEIASIIDALTTLYRVRLSMGLSPQKIAKDVVTAIRNATEPGISLTIEDQTTAIKRLTEVMAIESLNVIETKAQELREEFEHTFCDVRIFSDVRPVFGSNPADAPVAMLLVYNMKLGYHDSHEGRHREMYIALDTNDLASLRLAVDRAEKKAKAVQSKFLDTGIKTL